MVTQRKYLLWAGGVLLLILFFPSLFGTVFSSKDEVSYSAGLSMTTCQGFLANGYSSPESCRATYGIVLGNTGTNPQDEIQVTLSPVPETWLLGTGVLDIVASAQRRSRPDISHVQVDESLHITIANLEPNRLVELDVMTRGAEAAELLTSTTIQVDATGAVIESNPRLTVTARFFRNLLSLGF
jgi:hypothetical protein